MDAGWQNLKQGWVWYHQKPKVTEGKPHHHYVERMMSFKEVMVVLCIMGSKANKVHCSNTITLIASY